MQGHPELAGVVLGLAHAGRERNVAAFRRLFERAGLTLTATTPSGARVSVLSLVPAAVQPEASQGAELPSGRISPLS